MKRFGPEDRSIAAVGLLCVAGLLFAGQWATHRPPARIVAVPTVTPAPTPRPFVAPTPTSTPVPPGPLDIAMRGSHLEDVPGEAHSMAQVVMPIIKTHPGDMFSGEQWRILRSWWMPESKAKWEFYTGNNPPVLWYSQFFADTNPHKAINSGYIYAPIGHWKLEIQFDVQITAKYMTWVRSAKRTLEFKVDLAALHCTHLPQVKAAPLRPLEQRSKQRIARLQYGDGVSGKWHDLPQPGQQEFPLLVQNDGTMSFRVVKLYPKLPWPKSFGYEDYQMPIMWTSPSYNTEGPDDISVGFESSGLELISAQHNNIWATYVFVLPSIAE